MMKVGDKSKITFFPGCSFFGCFITKKKFVLDIIAIPVHQQVLKLALFEDPA